MPLPIKPSHAQELEVLPGLAVEVLPAHKVLKTRKRSFQLLIALPGEIRTMIYRELLVADKPIDIDWENPHLHPNILQTCKQFLREAHPILYEENVWMVRIGTPAHLQKAKPIVPPGPPKPLCSISFRKFSEERRTEMLQNDENPEMRSLLKSYFNDVFPRFLNGAAGCGLWRN